MEQENPSATPSSGVQNNNLLPASILVAAVLISGSIFYAVNRGGLPAPSGNNPPSPTGQTADIKTALAIQERDVILGDPKAKVVIIEYGDYQCPFCGRFFTQTEPLLKENYVKTNKAKLIYRDMAFLGPESVEAAKAAECAKDQGKFWAFHDALFAAEVKDGQEGNGNLNKTLFMQIAQETKLDSQAFVSCYDSGKYASVVQQITDGARNAGINATPTVFVNDTMIQGAQPYDQFKAVIDKLL